MTLINYLSRIHFGFGAIDKLKEELTKLDITRPLFVSDHGVNNAGIVDNILNISGHRDAPVFLDSPPNPTEASVRDCLGAYIAAKCNGFVAIGGGSPIDVAKGAALLATHKGRIGDYAVLTGGSEKIGPIAPIIAVPTTAGTGSEVGWGTIITLDTGRKIAAVNTNLTPKAVIADPELTFSMPKHITAATGVDALTHGIEAFLSPRFNPPADAIALDCIARIANNIELVFADGSDREARKEMLMGSIEGGLALQKGIGAIHAMSNPIGEYKLHHGTINAVLLPAVMDFNAQTERENMDRICIAIGLPKGSDLAKWSRALMQRLDMPSGLEEMGIPKGDLVDIAYKASKENAAKTNPRLATADDYLKMLHASY